MKDKLNNILNDTPCPDIHQFYDYLDGKLEATSKRDFELHLADCPFCTDALEGFEHSSRQQTIKSVEEINTRIKESKSNKVGYIWYVAASFLVLFGVGTLMMNNLSSEKKELAMEEKSIPQEEKMTPTESYPENEEDSVVEEEKEENFEAIEEQKVVTFEKKLEKEPQRDLALVEESKDEIEEADIDSEVITFEEEDKAVYAEPTIASNEVNTISTEKSAGAELVEESVVGNKDFSESKDKNAKPEMLAYTEAMLYTSVTVRISSDQESGKYYKRKLAKKAESPQAMSEVAVVEISDFENGLNHYRKEEYKKALTLFEKVEEDKSLIYEALCHIYLENDKKALSVLEKITKNTKSQNYFDALWLRIYILKNQEKAYSRELEILKNKTNNYQERAKMIN